MTAVVAGREASPGLHQHERPWPGRPALAVGWVAVATVVQLVRSPGVPTWRAVFGEDGGIFLTEALNRSGVGTLFAPYQGYLQLAPRVVGAVVGQFPLEAAAVLLAVFPALVVAGLSLYVFIASREVLRQRRSRAVLAILLVALPVGYDINASATNLHWYLDFACGWVFLARMQRRRQVAVGCLVAVTAALSDPLVGLFLPLAGFRVMQARRTPVGGSQRCRIRGLVAPGLFTLALLAQAAVVLVRQSPAPFVQIEKSELPQIYGLRVAGSFLVGAGSLPQLVRMAGPAVAIVSLLVVGAVLAVATARSKGRRRTLLVGLVAYSLLWLLVPLLLRGTATLLDVGRLALPGSRYTVNPILLLTTAMLLAAEPRTQARGRFYWPQAALAVVLLAGVVTSYRLPAQRTRGPVWSAELNAARGRCAAAGGRPMAVGRSAESPWGLPAGPRDALVPVSPTARLPGWSVIVSCAEILTKNNGQAGPALSRDAGRPSEVDTKRGRSAR